MTGTTEGSLMVSTRKPPTAGGNASAAGAGTQAISRTLAVLNLFRESESDLGISDIAKSLSLSVSTVHRIVRALVDENYLSQDLATERYTLGRAAMLLGEAANRRLGLDRAKTVVERLRDELGESVNLGVRDGGEMVVVISAESKQLLRFSQAPGNRLPVHATAMGKATLSHSPRSIEDEVAALDMPLRRLTRKTITSPTTLCRELTLIRRRGYSIDDQEAIEGVRCVAVPILSPEGDLLAAMGVQGPAVRMTDEKLKRAVRPLRSAAQEVAHLLPPRPL
jgi:IclR family acetate operon transcriptional repressor